MSKPITPRNFSCTHVNGDGTLCAAKVGERCSWQGNDAAYFNATKFHAARQVTARLHHVDGLEYNREHQEAIHAALTT